MLFNKFRVIFIFLSSALILGFVFLYLHSDWIKYIDGSRFGKILSVVLLAFFAIFLASNTMAKKISRTVSNSITDDLVRFIDKGLATVAEDNHGLSNFEAGAIKKRIHGHLEKILAKMLKEKLFWSYVLDISLLLLFLAGALVFFQF